MDIDVNMLFIISNNKIYFVVVFIIFILIKLSNKNYIIFPKMYEWNSITGPF